MADILDQDAIDQLLNSSMSYEEDEPEQSDDLDDDSPAKIKRIIKPSFQQKMRFDYRYRSPILKGDDLVVDPEDESSRSGPEPVVWTLKNYNSMRQKKLVAKKKK